MALFIFLFITLDVIFLIGWLCRGELKLTIYPCVVLLLIWLVRPKTFIEYSSMWNFILNKIPYGKIVVLLFVIGLIVVSLFDKLKEHKKDHQDVGGK